MGCYKVSLKGFAARSDLGLTPEDVEKAGRVEAMRVFSESGFRVQGCVGFGAEGLGFGLLRASC